MNSTKKEVERKLQEIVEEITTSCLENMETVGEQDDELCNSFKEMMINHTVDKMMLAIEKEKKLFFKENKPPSAFKRKLNKVFLQGEKCEFINERTKKQCTKEIKKNGYCSQHFKKIEGEEESMEIAEANDPLLDEEDEQEMCHFITEKTKKKCNKPPKEEGYCSKHFKMMEKMKEQEQEASEEEE